MKLKLFTALMIFPFLLSCQAVSTSMAVIGGSTACDSNQKKQSFPEAGSKKTLNVSFDIRENDKTLHFEESATCEYQGSICGGGAWFQVWYGDQSLPSVEVPLNGGDRLLYNEHTQCIHMDNFVKACENENCEPANVFGIRILFSEENVSLRKSQIESGELKEREGEYFVFPDRDYVPFSKLHEFGIGVENLHVSLKMEKS